MITIRKTPTKKMFSFSEFVSHKLSKRHSAKF
jgi:hypothetical protein